MDPQSLRKRYRYLWTGEATASILFVLLFTFYVLADPAWAQWLLRGYALAVTVFILLQGVFWWRWKLRILAAGQRTLPAGVLRWYRRLKWINWLLIALFPVLLWLKWRLGAAQWSDNDTWIGLLILCGAILEQINYYYVQLMYDSGYDWAYLRTHRRLRPGSIGKALAQAE